MVFSEITLTPMSAFFLQLPETDYGRNDIVVAVEYVRNENIPEEVQCWAWAQVGDASALRGLVAEFPVPYNSDEDALRQEIVTTLANSNEFRTKLPGYISHIENH